MFKLAWYYNGKERSVLIWSAPKGVCYKKKKELESVPYNGEYRILPVG